MATSFSRSIASLGWRSAACFWFPWAASQENVQVLLYFATQLLESLAGYGRGGKRRAEG